EYLEEDPFVVVGSFVPQLGGNARLGSSESAYLVAEVDEYRYHFLDFSATYTILTTLDYDHPDVFTSEASYRNAFHRYLDQFSSEGVLVANRDNPGVTQLLQERPETDQFRIITYGEHEDADVQLKEDAYIYVQGERVATLTLSLSGEHNRSNATGVFALLWHLGFSPERITSAIEPFRGLARRQELKGRMNTGATLIDDYAHHPAEIRAVYNALREEYPDHRLWIIFQPHTYTRTEALKDDIANALGDFDVVWLRPVYGSAREKEGNVSADDIRELILANSPHHDESTVKDIVSERAMEATLRTETGHNDILVTMGAGNIHKLGEHLIEPN
ncbi:MAG: glutamate ligase domain-containing protein, partial [Candidatus Paceibacteria bacterium]